MNDKPYLHALSWRLVRSSHLRCSVRISQNSYENTSVRAFFISFSVIPINVLYEPEHIARSSNLQPATLLKKRLLQRCFPVNFAKFLRTPFLQNTSGGCFWLVLVVSCYRRCIENPVKHLTPTFLRQHLKAHRQISKKTAFWNVFFIWKNMPIFSFLGYNQTELLRKPDN